MGVLDDADDKECVEALFHHRMPTSTENVLNACHPFSTGQMFKHNYVLAHNGIIWNENKLHEAHEERGIKYNSMQPDGKFNDSESLLWEIAMYLEGIVESPGTKGGAAFIVIEQALTPKGAKPVKLHFGRNDSNPLYLTLNDARIELASQKGQWDDEAHAIMPDFLYTFDYRTKKLSLKPMKLETYRVAKPAGHGVAHKHVTSPGWQGGALALQDEGPDYYSQQENDENRKWWEEQYKKPTPAIEIPAKPKLLTGDDLDKAADNYLSRLLDKEKDIEDVEFRLNTDTKRANQAVTQLGEIVRNGGARTKVIKKYYKYLQFLHTCMRASAMLALITDPVEEATHVHET